LSELILGLADGAAPVEVDWEDETGKRTRVAAGGSAPSQSIAVFTRRWVEENLSAFLDGESASAIVTLGKEAIDAKEEEAQLVDEIAGWRNQARQAATQKQSVDDKITKHVRDVQDRIISELKAFDYAHFTKNRYSLPKVQEDLRNYKGQYPDSDAHAEALKRLGEEAPHAVPGVSAPPARDAQWLTDLTELLKETPTRVAIQALETNSRAQTWAEEGLGLHTELDHCLFCDGEVTVARREELARHFDESWLHIRHRAEDLLAVIRREGPALIAWRDNLPKPAALASELQPVYEEAVRRAETEVSERVAALEALKTALEAKAADPSATPQTPECSILNTVPSMTVLGQVVTEHNDRVNRHTELTAERKQTVLNHLVGSQSETFRQLEQQRGELASKKDNADKAVVLAERRLDEVRQSQFTTKDMADTLTLDLTRVYGKNHLNVAVTPDGKSYACRRGDKPGTDLSDGERTTLSLLYFLRKLEDEQAAGNAPSQRLVVIDDPSSSLDREALFATHQWLIDTLKPFGQYIILTHDFGLLRLFIKSHKNAWGKSMSDIRKGDEDELRFPKVSFLEMYAGSVDGQRRSKVGKLPGALLSNTSEYAYLFSMVMAGIADSEDHDRLFLLPNAARRILEVFASYKAPHRSDFLQQLEVLVESQDGEPYRDVYDFCNRYSHGEGSESIDVLDARAVYGHIRRCMEFLRSVDREHFERMCKATNTEVTILD